MATKKRPNRTATATGRRDGRKAAGCFRSNAQKNAARARRGSRK